MDFQWQRGFGPSGPDSPFLTRFNAKTSACNDPSTSKRELSYAVRNFFWVSVSDFVQLQLISTAPLRRPNPPFLQCTLPIHGRQEFLRRHLPNRSSNFEILLLLRPRGLSILNPLLAQRTSPHQQMAILKTRPNNPPVVHSQRLAPRWYSSDPRGSNLRRESSADTVCQAEAKYSASLTTTSWPAEFTSANGGRPTETFG